MSRYKDVSRARVVARTAFPVTISQKSFRLLHFPKMGMRGLELIWTVHKGAPWSLREYTCITVREIIVGNTRCRCHSVACGDGTKHVDRWSDLTKNVFMKPMESMDSRSMQKKKKKNIQNFIQD